ncbi:MAG: DNA polymerase IV [Arcicella sp.]|nr:DNA polymerase IV [Arcicella sp.]
MQDRAIVHMDLDSFFVSVERLRNSQLVGKPVIVGGQSDRAVVAACSYETRKFGVQSAMPMKLARQLCPDAIILRGDFEAYSAHSEIVTNIITETAPLVEKAPIDEFYLDMTGMEKFFGTYKFATELRQKVLKESGLSISFGLSENKTVSKVATNEAKPAGQMQVLRGNERTFLAPLSVAKIPMIGNVTAQTLRNMGISQVGTLSQMPLKLLEKTFGKLGKTLWEKANGIDFSPVIPYSEQKSMSKEMTFEKDTTDVALLKALFINMTEQLTYDLRKSGHCSGCISVKIRYSNFDTQSKQLSIPITTADHVLIAHALELFEKLYDRRLLIRLVGVRFTKLVRGMEQLNIFDKSAKLAPLYQAMDNIRDWYGVHSVGRAVNLSQRNRIG